MRSTWWDSVSLLGGAELPVDKWNVDVCMTGAQKAIAAPPGISPISVSPRAKKYMIENPPNTMYFNLARYFKYYEESRAHPVHAGPTPAARIQGGALHTAGGGAAKRVPAPPDVL